MSEFGKIVTEKRIKLGYSLRKFCKKFEYDCGNQSKMERGILPPPKGEKLGKLASALEIKGVSRYSFVEAAEKELWPEKAENRKLKQENEKLKKQLGYANSCVVIGRANIMNGTQTGLDQIDTYMNKYIYINSTGKTSEQS